MHVKLDRIGGNSGLALPRVFTGEYNNWGQNELAILAGLEAKRSDNPSQDFPWEIQPSSLDNNHLAALQPASASAVVNNNFGTPPVFPGGSIGRIIPDSVVFPTSSTTEAIFDRSPNHFGNAITTLAAGGSAVNLLDQVTGLKPELGFALDWTFREQIILEEGLTKYANDPKFKRYIKIAALLPEKTVRDVALRCQWMNRNENGKRRKLEDYINWKKFKERKDNNLRGSSSTLKRDVTFLQPNASCSLAISTTNPDKHLRNEAIDDSIFHLLEENIQLLSQIEHNLENFKLQDNINLFCLSKNNISSMISRMMESPGMMSHMPPLPVVIHDEVANTALFGPTVVE